MRARLGAADYRINRLAVGKGYGSCNHAMTGISATALAVRDRIVDGWMESTVTYGRRGAGSVISPSNS